MKVVAHTGLVPVSATRRFKTKPAGSIFGIPPEMVMEAVKSGDVELVDIPEGIETIEVEGFQFTAPPPAEVDPDDEDLVEIPDDWKTAHGSKRAMIAKAILGLEPKAKLPVPDGQDVAQFAYTVIEEELARRAALTKPDDQAE